MRSPITGLIAVAFFAAGQPVAFAAPAVTAQGTAEASSLGLDGEGTASTCIVKIGFVSVSTSASQGFTLSVSSGQLTKSDGSTPVGFQVALVARDAPAPSSAAFTTPSGMTYILATASASTVDKDIYIKYAPARLQDPGSYTASVQLGAVDN